MANEANVVIVGGGVVGTSIAYFASRADIPCTLLDRGTIGGGASNAASGALSASPGSGAYARLSQRSLALFHEHSPLLKDHSGVDIEFAECGELVLALDEGDVIALQGLARQLRELGADVSWVDQAELLQMEPNINPEVVGGLFEPEVCRVNNQRLSAALAASAAKHGADIRQGVEVTGLSFQDDRVTGVDTTDGPIAAGIVVLAAGAWTGHMDRWLYGQSSPSSAGSPMVRPVRGVNLNLTPRHGTVSSVIHGSWGILVPRNDGSLVVGATVEEVGFDGRVTAGNVESILNVGSTLMPSLSDADLNWALAGLRPGSGDDVPVIGPLPDHDNVIVASGHFRNGILLCLATGEAVTGLIQGRPPEHIAAFSPERFF